jgi:hypothetical protein
MEFREIKNINELCDFLNENPDYDGPGFDNFPSWGDDPQTTYGYREGYYSYDDRTKEILVPNESGETHWMVESYEEFMAQNK